MNNIKRFFLLLATALVVLPMSAFAQGELERAHMLSEMKWTPIHDIQLCGKKAKFCKAGEEKTGMLYSSVAIQTRVVPYDVSLYTFYTCLHNPYSVLYTECLNPNFPRSAYGHEYKGGRLSGPWMGCVCSVFSSYAAGFAFQEGSPLQVKLFEKGILSKPENQSAQGAEQFDILWHEGHCRFITDVTRDSEGKVTHVEISESVSPTVKRRTFTAAGFDSIMDVKKMVIYRRADMSAQGRPPVYEMPDPIVYNDDICTYAGDRVCFAEGEHIIIHCFNRKYKTMELYKDGQLLTTIRLEKSMIVHNADLGIRGNLEYDPGAYAVDLSGLDLGPGSYQARLAKGSKHSAPTEFDILEAKATYSREDGKLHFESCNAKPVYYQINGGIPKLFTEKAAKRGALGIKAKPERKYRIRVYFQGRWGRVRTIVNIPKQETTQE